MNPETQTPENGERKITPITPDFKLLLLEQVEAAKKDKQPYTGIYKRFGISDAVYGTWRRAFMNGTLLPDQTRHPILFEQRKLFEAPWSKKDLATILKEAVEKNLSAMPTVESTPLPIEEETPPPQKPQKVSEVRAKSLVKAREVLAAKRKEAKRPSSPTLSTEEFAQKIEFIIEDHARLRDYFEKIQAHLAKIGL